MMEERLQKIMAELGVASRRKCEELIKQGKVRVNSIIVTELGTKVDKQTSVIEVEGKRLIHNINKVYVLLNKPIGYITSAKDQFNRPTVLDLMSNIEERIFPVGRLDYDTEGLLILTNDGELTYKITHPSHNIKKTYTARVKGRVQNTAIEMFKNGLNIEDYKTAPASLKILKFIENDTLVSITIHEGKNRQVRKMCDAIGHKVLELKRISIGKLKLGDLAIGHWRYLTVSEVEYLYSLEDN
ncbi:MAG: pseudouridine synthase [Clostridiales bacterium GWB2_37_7]|nr:MAG: pseudouridine synthase [Clostridiales bacterium GWB2_37_7]